MLTAPKPHLKYCWVSDWFLPFFFFFWPNWTVPSCWVDKAMASMWSFLPSTTKQCLVGHVEAARWHRFDLCLNLRAALGNCLTCFCPPSESECAGPYCTQHPVGYCVTHCYLVTYGADDTLRYGCKGLSNIASGLIQAVQLCSTCQWSYSLEWCARSSRSATDWWNCKGPNYLTAVGITSRFFSPLHFWLGE